MGRSVDSIEISTDKGMKIRISKTPQQRGAMVTPRRCRCRRSSPRPSRTADLHRRKGYPSRPKRGVRQGGSTQGEAAGGEVADGRHLLPLAGTRGRRTSSEGTRVEKGQILCIIEAMKIMNEIESEYSGVVREVLVAGRASGGVRAGPLPRRPEWLTRRRRSPRAAAPTHAAAQVDIPVPATPASFNFKAVLQRDDPAECVGRAPQGRSAPVLRVNGDLMTLELPPLKPEDLKSLAEQIMTPKQVKEFAEAKEADFAIGVPGIGRFRVNVYQQRGTIAYAMRAVPYQVRTAPSSICRRSSRTSRFVRADSCSSRV